MTHVRYSVSLWMTPTEGKCSCQAVVWWTDWSHIPAGRNGLVHVFMRRTQLESIWGKTRSIWFPAGMGSMLVLSKIKISIWKESRNWNTQDGWVKLSESNTVQWQTALRNCDLCSWTVASRRSKWNLKMVKKFSVISLPIKDQYLCSIASLYRVVHTVSKLLWWDTGCSNNHKFQL